MADMNISLLDYSNETYYCPNGDCSYLIEEVYEKLRQDDFKNILIITVLLAILCFVGTLGNLCVLIVFSKRFPKRTSTLFILVLGAIDLLICLFVIPGVIVKTWYLSFYWDWVCKAWEMFRMYSLPTSALLLAAIALDRYFLICMSTNALMTIKRAKIVIAAITIGGLTFSIPPLLAVGVYEIDDDGFKVYRGICIENYGLITVVGLHQYWLFVTLIFLAVILIVAVLYARVFLTVYKQDKKWRNNRSKIQPCPNRLHPKRDLHTKSVEETSAPRSIQQTVTEDLAGTPGSEPLSSCTQMFCCRKATKSQSELFIIQVKPGSSQQDAPMDSDELRFQADNGHCSLKKGDMSMIKETDKGKSVIHSDFTSRETDINPSASIPFQTKTDNKREVTLFPGTVAEIGSHSSRDNNQHSVRNTCSVHFETTPTYPEKTMESDSSLKRNGANFSRGQQTDHSMEISTIPGTVIETEVTLDSALPCTSRGIKAPILTTVIEANSNQGGNNDRAQHRAHVKTARVVFMVTLVYIVSFLPTFLVTYQVINNEALFYIYFLNNAANPIIYSFMNKKFRTEVRNMARHLWKKLRCAGQNH